MQNKITAPILFDIDRTLIDSERSLELLDELISKELGLEIDYVRKIRNDYYASLVETRLFNFYDLLTLFKPSSEKFSKIIHIHKTDPSVFPLFPDSLPTLDYLRSNGYGTGIFSEGIPEVQRNKILITRVIDHLDPTLIFIGEKKSSEEFLSRVPKGSVIIDDKLAAIEFLEKHGGFDPIWLDRSGGQMLTTGHKVIHTLTDLKKLF